MWAMPDNWRFLMNWRPTAAHCRGDSCRWRISVPPCRSLITRWPAVFAVKAQAATQLLQTLNHGGRYLILYSSAAATLGASGQSAHALACGYLDGLAQQFSTLMRRKRSLSLGRMGESGPGGHAGNVGGARQPWHGCVKRC